MDSRDNSAIDSGRDLKIPLGRNPERTTKHRNKRAAALVTQLKGNIGDQNYDLPAGIELPPASYTALVWCEAFSVEFVGATIDI